MVTVKLFGSLKSIAGKGEVDLSVHSVKDLMNSLKQTYGKQFDTQLRTSKIFKNGENIAYLSGAKTALTDGDTVIMVPPTAGG